jgi:hypothetical protein
LKKLKFIILILRELSLNRSTQYWFVFDSEGVKWD